MQWIQEKETISYIAWNFDGDPQLPQEQPRGQEHGGYKAYALDLGARDEAHTWKFEDMAAHSPGQLEDIQHVSMSTMKAMHLI